MNGRWGEALPFALGAAHQASNSSLNERARVLAALHRLGRTTRVVVARETGLNRAVVQQRLADLGASGLVADAGIEASSGGRPPKQVRFRAEAGCVLAADLGATSIDVATCDLDGAILAHAAEDADIAAGPEAILSRLEISFDRLLTDPMVAGRPLWGIGVGLPGPIEFETGRPVSPPIMPGWDGCPVRDRLGDRFDAPVWVDNDVNVMALGERTKGIARQHDNVVFIKVGTGIGAGIISHGRLHRGAQGSAGDMGHIQATTDPSVRCRCGKIGCLEAAVGGAALGRQAEELARSGESPDLAGMLAERSSLSAADLVSAALHGDLAAIALLQQAGRLIGGLGAAIVNFFNPSLIVVGGGVANAGDLLLSGIREVIYARSTPLSTRHLQVQRSSLGDRAGVTGAATMVLDELFGPARLIRWIAAGSSAGMPELASG